MNSIDKLTELFGKLPGIGPRQARRFVYYLLYRSESFRSELVRAIESLNNEIRRCESCLRFFPKNGGANKLCKICESGERDNSILMLVPRDIDLDAVEKSHSYNGRYFVLGGVIPILDKEPEKHVRLAELDKRLRDDLEIKEVILAMNANQDGEHTADFLKERFANTTLTFSTLGRGLSTGAELEYADPETLKNALQNRQK